jgi:hypothetical protein
MDRGAYDTCTKTESYVRLVMRGMWEIDGDKEEGKRGVKDLQTHDQRLETVTAWYNKMYSD